MGRGGGGGGGARRCGYRIDSWVIMLCTELQALLCLGYHIIQLPACIMGAAPADDYDQKLDGFFSQGVTGTMALHNVLCINKDVDCNHYCMYIPLPTGCGARRFHGPGSRGDRAMILQISWVTGGGHDITDITGDMGHDITDIMSYGGHDITDIMSYGGHDITYIMGP